MTDLPEITHELPAAPYPAPPPFWKFFTTDAIAELESLPASDASGSQQLSSLPTHLLPLRPPQPPRALPSYTAFSQSHALNPAATLPGSDILLFDSSKLDTQYKTASTSAAPQLHAQLLTKLTKSLVLNFLELTTIMGDEPSEYDEKIKDISMLFENVAGVLNMLRPHMAREGVKALLRRRIEVVQGKCEDMDRACEDIEELMKELERGSATGMGKEGENDKDKMVLDERGGNPLETEEGHEKTGLINGFTSEQETKEMNRAREMLALIADLDGD